MTTQIAVLRIHCKLYDFVTAKKLADLVFQELLASDGVWPQWIDFAPAAIRVYSELKCRKELELLKAFIQEIPEDKTPRSSIWSLKGRVGMENRDVSFAEVCFQKALATSQSQEETERALYGIGTGFVMTGKNQEASEIFSKILSLTKDPEMEIAALGMLAQIVNALNEPTQSLSLLSEAKTKCKINRNLYLLLMTLAAEVEIYLLMGQTHKAQESLTRIEDILPSDFNGISHERVSKLQKGLTTALTAIGFELVESAGRIILKTPSQQIVDLTTQPILVQLLHILAKQPRKAVSKEEICQILWATSYHPFEADNKIYVTIRRLRVAIGDATEKPKYILKTNDGYFLNSEYQFTTFQYKYIAPETEGELNC
jgi:DNA-binding winged helix-turn-helix (wHTH) protein